MIRYGENVIYETVKMDVFSFRLKNRGEFCKNYIKNKARVSDVSCAAGRRFL